MVIRIPKGKPRKWRKAYAEDRMVWGDEPLPPEQEPTLVPIADSTKRFSTDQDGIHRQSTPRRAMQPSLEHFKRSIIDKGGTPALAQFFDRSFSTETWTKTYFPFVELEVHQLVTVNRAAAMGAAGSGRIPSSPSIANIRTQYVFLGAIAADSEIRNILATSATTKDHTADIFSRFLDRQKSTILKWAQRR
jgi:hypothetical protein